MRTIMKARWILRLVVLLLTGCTVLQVVLLLTDCTVLQKETQTRGKTLQTIDAVIGEYERTGTKPEYPTIAEYYAMRSICSAHRTHLAEATPCCFLMAKEAMCGNAWAMAGAMVILAPMVLVVETIKMPVILYGHYQVSREDQAMALQYMKKARDLGYTNDYYYFGAYFKLPVKNLDR